MSLDSGTLDALLAGALDCADEERAWQDIIQSPEGGAAWDAALRRQRETALLAGAIRGRPWLASILGRLGRLRRRPGHPPGWQLELWERGALIRATLGAEHTGQAAPIRLAWGEVQTRPVPLGATVELVAAPGEPVVVIGLCCQAEQILVHRMWRLEPGEAPVLLVALAGSAAGLSLAEALAAGHPLAGVLLLEEEPPPCDARQ